MRFIIPFLFAVLCGCATMHRSPDGEVEASYTGPSAIAAARLVNSTDGRPYGLAEKAMSEGMTTNLRRASDGSIVFGAGYGYYGYGAVGGYAPADVVSVGGWYARSGAGSTLPVLGQSVVSSVPSVGVSTTSNIVPCPTDRTAATVAEQAACISAEHKSLVKSLKIK